MKTSRFLTKNRLIRLLVLTAGAGLTFKFLLLPVRLADRTLSTPAQTLGYSLVNTLSYWRSSPERGDIVAIRMAGSSVVHVKRVVGLPGEDILILRGQVFVDGEVLAEPYVMDRRPWNLRDTPLENDEYFVIGDYRDMPLDRSFTGRVKRDRILGRLVW